MAKTIAEEEVDFIVSNHGTIWLLEPRTEAARLWIKEHVGGDQQWLGNALAVEHRFIFDLIRGITDEGYGVK